jgi:hypothetical protein
MLNKLGGTSGGEITQPLSLSNACLGGSSYYQPVARLRAVPFRNFSEGGPCYSVTYGLPKPWRRGLKGEEM